MSLFCKAALTRGDGNFFIDRVELDDPAEDEVLVRIKAAGLCHTDHDSMRWGKTMVMGHEGAGIVEKTGTDVKDLTVGDRVILNWAIPCGHCFQCREGNEHICENNSPVIAGNDFNAGHAHAWGTKYEGLPLLRSFNLGTLSEFALVKEAALVRNHVPGISFPAASIIGCGVMTGFGSVVNAARVRAGSSVAVLGCGGVGLNVIQGARICGASFIIAIDTNENRLKMAVDFGATHTIIADKNDKGLLNASEHLKQLLGGRGADYAFECTAIPELGAAPLAMVRNAGMALQLSGIEREVNIDMNLFEWDKTYINPLYGKCRPKIDFPRILDHYKNGELLLEEMVTRTYSLNQLDEAFHDMLKGRNAKGVIIFE